MVLKDNKQFDLPFATILEFSITRQSTKYNLIFSCHILFNGKYIIIKN
jgi:hypothetical protein